MVSGLVLLMLVLWLGFAVHRSPDFAGSGWGGAFAVLGAALMLVPPLVYTLVKRIAPLRRAVTPHLSMARILNTHIYAGLLGAILVLMHTGHKFESTLGIALTTMTLLVVLSGFVVRYFLGLIGDDVRNRRNRLESARNEYQRMAAALTLPAQGDAAIVAVVVSAQMSPLLSAIADLEYGIAAEERLKRFLSRSLGFHIIATTILYLLLGLHIWAALEYGLRWFQ